MNNETKTAVAVAGEPIAPGTLSLPELVAKLNHEHEQVKECLIRGAHHAVRAGELLWEAKRKAGHGRWLEWIAVNCKFSERTAQLYMKLATALPQLANPQRIADLSLTGAIEMIEGLKDPDRSRKGVLAKRRTRSQRQSGTRRWRSWNEHGTKQERTNGIFS
jgi:hypothetical protein